ncbi:MAG: HAMP domain-containing histidine kinase [Actinomycetota bacterium]|nr:HAMP domain-containing histidine kinase [Actinomycetota bacterium]
MGTPSVHATLRVKLALVLFGVVAAVLAIVYGMVVPRLESRLVDAKIDQVEQAAEPVAVEIRRAGDDRVALQDTVDFAATNLNARVVIFQRLGEDAVLTYADSSQTAGSELAEDPIALRALTAGGLQSGRVVREHHEFAEVARMLGPEIVVLISAPLDDALADVRLVRRSVVVAGVVALLAAAVAAYLAALGLTRRVRRLETAANRIAAGDFGAPVEAEGSDEVAQLSRTFDRMRIRLADLDRVRREFIANASHELRTPLFAVGGFLELLDDEQLDAETREEFLAETRTQVDRLTRLATDLLDLSRLDAGQLELGRAPVDLASAARLVAEEFRAVADASEHPLRVAAEGDVYALGDHERVVQILRILVENALRHTPAGTPVELAAGARDGRATLAVRDEGPGIPPADQEHVFERFFRAGGRNAFGSGLGLAIASELATRMGGRLSVDSRAGATTFTLELVGDEAFRRENGDRRAAVRETASA